MAELPAYSDLKVEQVVELAGDGGPEALQALVPLHSLLQTELRAFELDLSDHVDIEELERVADLQEAAARVVAQLEEWGVDGILSELERLEHRFVYPVQAWPTRVRSFNLDKDPTAGGVLQGIKGQYLIFDAGVINLRKYTGYEVDILAG